MSDTPEPAPAKARDEESPEHKAHMKIIDRAIKRRHRLRPANEVDRIRVTDLAAADALHERIRAAGLTGKKRERPLTDDDFRRVTLPVIHWQAVMVDELAAQQGITPEKFMSAILSEGLYEAYLEFHAQRQEAIRAARRLPAAPRVIGRGGMDDDISF